MLDFETISALSTWDESGKNMESYVNRIFQRVRLTSDWNAISDKRTQVWFPLQNVKSVHPLTASSNCCSSL